MGSGAGFGRPMLIGGSPTGTRSAGAEVSREMGIGQGGEDGKICKATPKCGVELDAIW